jgi:hypothetical protein
MAARPTLDELVRRFPETKYRKQIDEFEDRYALHRAHGRIKNIDRFQRSPESDAERLYAEGWRFERFDDMLSAWRKYEEVLKTADKKDVNERAYATLAHRGIDRIKAKVDSQQELAELVQRKLDEADKLVADKKQLQARRLLDEIVSIYGEEREVRALVDEARNRIAALDAAK